jgi:uncharacterized membrane protein YhaH (DUF805 family)
MPYLLGRPEREQSRSAPPVYDLEVVMSFAAAIKSVLSQYATFSGRARRSEYWWYALAYTIVSWALSAWTFSNVDLATMELGSGYFLAGGVSGLFSLALLLPTLAVAVRRLHDTDKSGFRVFWSLLPVVGPILLIVWLATAGTAGPNRFGADPKAAAAPAQAAVAV